MERTARQRAEPDRPLLVTGSTGRIGRLLRAVWTLAPPEGMRPVWQVRGPATRPDEVSWDILGGTVPDLPSGATLLHLAGSTARNPATLDQHAPLAAAVSAAATRIAARVILHASSAAVYGPSDLAHSEEETPAPSSAYGAAKLAAERALNGPVPRVILRIGNIAGADALLGAQGSGRTTLDPVALDPVAGQPGGPVRSYIGPRSLVSVLTRLIATADLPDILNIAQDPPVAMADLLQAAGRAWQFGPDNPQVIARACLACGRLQAVCPDLTAATADGLVAEMASLAGLWP